MPRHHLNVSHTASNRGYLACSIGDERASAAVTAAPHKPQVYVPA